MILPPFGGAANMRLTPSQAAFAASSELPLAKEMLLGEAILWPVSLRGPSSMRMMSKTPWPVSRMPAMVASFFAIVASINVSTRLRFRL